MFECKIHKNLDCCDIKVFELDESYAQTLKDTIKSKIKSIKVYADDYYEDLLPPNVDQEFKERLKQKILEITRPRDHALKWFDVKRAYTSEFMSQLLLEHEYNCIFHEESDKKINVSPVDIDKPIPGIDVVGLQQVEDEYKFIVCEVKASKASQIPCSSANDLLGDIEKAIGDNKRIEKEILQYIEGISGISNETVEKTVSFLTDLLLPESSKSAMFEKIIFFPFMIRNNQRIVAEENIGDLSLFDTEDFEEFNLSGVIWSFNEDIDDFCLALYNEALGELGYVS